MSYTGPLTITPGAAPVPVQVGAVPPAGFTLINRADNGGTIWVAAGPNGAQLPLTPGGSLVWNDPAVYPYASLAASATAPETLVVTDQVRGFDNPEAVAAATATQLAAQGVPSTMLDTNYGTFQLQSTHSSPYQQSTVLDVHQSAGLVVSVLWSQNSPTSGAVCRLAFDDPSFPNTSPLYLYLTQDNAYEPLAQNTWRVPVLGPRLTIAQDNAANSPAYITVVGTNRPTDRLRILGDELGVRQFGAACATTATVDLPAYNTTSGAAPSQSPQSRLNGAVVIQTWTAGGAGTVYLNFVDATGVKTKWPIPVSAGIGNPVSIAHPPVPVHWQYAPAAASSGNFCTLTVSQAE